MENESVPSPAALFNGLVVDTTAHVGFEGLDLSQLQQRERFLVDERKPLTLELGDLYASRASSGSRGDVVIEDRAKIVLNLAREIANGPAPSELAGFVRGINREVQLHLVRDGVDLALKWITSRKEPALDEAAQAWREAHLQEWTALAADIVKTACRLSALEARVHSLLETVPGGPIGIRMPMTEYIAQSYSLSAYPQTLIEASRAAVEQGLISEAALRRASDIR